MASEAGVGGRRPHHGGTASGEPHPRPAAPAPAGRRRWLALAAVLVLGVAFALGVRSMQQVVASRPQPGRPAPDFTLPQLDGPAVRLAGLRGRVVALNFWASWCEPCREEAPALQAFYERYGDRLAFYGINVAEPVDTVRDFIAEFGLTYPVLLDRDRAVSRRYGVAAFPETWWIDPEGIARVHWVGPMTFEDMQRLYEQAAGEPIDPEGSGPVAPGQRLLDLVIDGAGRAWAATSSGLWRSDDGGATWRPIPGFEGAEVTAVLWLPAGPGQGAGASRGGTAPAAGPDAGRLLVAGSSFGVRVSDDGGRTWQAAGEGLPGTGATAITASPSGRVQYTWVKGHGLYRRDTGVSGRWQPVPGELSPSLERVGLLALDERGDRLLAAASGGLLYSADGGRTWREAGLEEPLLDIAPLPAAARASQGAAGATGTRGEGDSGAAGQAAEPAAGAAGSAGLILAGQEGLWRAAVSAGRENGSRPVAGVTHLTVPKRAWVAVAVAPDGRFWLAAAPNGDLLRSGDGGAHWEYVRGRRAP